MSAEIERILAGLGEQDPQPCYVVWGDRVLSEPAALRLGEGLARRFEGSPEVHRRPARLAPLLDDLRTFSLFSPAKVIVAVESAILADLAAAASLIDEAIEVLPVQAAAGELTPGERRGAIRLLQALRLFQLDPYSGEVGALLAELPDWSLGGPGGPRRRRRSAARIRKLRTELGSLLEAARGAELEGWGESEADGLAEIISNGLPRGHTLVLAESSVAEKHPVASALAERGALIRVGGVEADRRKGWQGLEQVAAELERQTGVAIQPAALQELARRTLRLEGRGSWGDKEVAAESISRFAAEYRKLAALAGQGGAIEPAQVEAAVEDRGEEDVWKILDAVSAGEAEQALGRLRRYLASAEDPVAARLSLFALLAGFCRQLAAIGALLEAASLPRGESRYGSFKARIAPALQEKRPGGGENPLAGLHPYRLHRAYLAASRLPEESLKGLVSRVLETELRLKGESGSPDAALALLISELATAARRAGTTSSAG